MGEDVKTTLYLGTDPTQFESQGRASGHLIHYPVIKIVPRSVEEPEIAGAFDDLGAYTHLIFTSKNAVKVFFSHLKSLKIPVEALKGKTVIAIGEVTAAHLCANQIPPTHISKMETQEGVVQLLNRLDLENAYIFMPRSSLSRPVLANFFIERQIRFQACDLYETLTHEIDPKPDLELVDEVVFTSPSTVKAFVEIFGTLPKGKKCLAIGPITEQALRDSFTKAM
jgi:uroporphyrinogen-III synthase